MVGLINCSLTLQAVTHTPCKKEMVSRMQSYVYYCYFCMAHNKIFGIEILLHQFGTQISGHYLLYILYYKDCFLDVMHCEKGYGYIFQSLFISVVASSITVKKVWVTSTIFWSTQLHSGVSVTHNVQRNTCIVKNLLSFSSLLISIYGEVSCSFASASEGVCWLHSYGRNVRNVAK